MLPISIVTALVVSYISWDKFREVLLQQQMECSLMSSALIVPKCLSWRFKFQLCMRVLIAPNPHQQSYQISWYLTICWKTVPYCSFNLQLFWCETEICSHRSIWFPFLVNGLYPLYIFYLVLVFIIYCKTIYIPRKFLIWARSIFPRIFFLRFYF